MNKLTFAIIAISLCLSVIIPSIPIPTETGIVTEVQAKTKAKKVSKTEKKIKRAANIYAKGHILQQYRYESAFEILEEFNIKVTKKNVKLINKWVKHYEKKYIKQLKLR
jgi:hypothetical protein